MELRALGGTVDLPAYLTRTYGHPARLPISDEQPAVSVIALGTSLRLIGNTPSDREAFLRYVPWAEAFGATSLRVFDGGTDANPSEMCEALSTLDWWRNLRAKQGWSVDIAVETHDAFALEDNLARFVRLEPLCPLIWDAHHTWRKGAASLWTTWAILRHQVRHIHVKDSKADPAARLGYEYVLPGEGEFPMQELVDLLWATSYNGVISLEWEKLWHPDLPPLATALSAAEASHWW